MPARVAAAVLLVLAGLVAGGPAAAQEWSPFRGIIRLFGGEPRVEPRPVPPPVRVRPTRPRPERPDRVIRLDSQETKPASETPKAADAQVVLLIGDSLAAGLGAGLEAAFATRPDVVVVNKTRSQSGLIRDDFYDWNAVLPQLLAETKPVAVVIMIGGNDRQPLYAAGGRIAERLQSPRWEEVYVERAKRLAGQVKASGKPLIWVGLPPAARSEFSAFLASINDLIKGPVQQSGAAWIDIWDAFSDDSGRYTPGGPDIEGEVRRLRANDGVHFTKAGQRKLAFFVETELSKILRGGAPPVAVGEAAEPAPAPEPEPPAAVAVPDPKLVTPEPPRTGAQEPTLQLGEIPPVPPTPSLNVPPPPWRRPGPVVPLSGPAGSERELAGTAPPSLGPVPVDGNPGRRRLVEGQPIDPPAGRADDFRWPGAPARP